MSKPEVPEAATGLSHEPSSEVRSAASPVPEALPPEPLQEPEESVGALAVRHATWALSGMRRFYERFAPWISLALGSVSRALSHRTIDFAPKATALLALAWLLPLIVARWLPEPPSGAEASRWRQAVRSASSFLVVVLFRNVLFFLVPVWFGSASWSSINILFPLGLAGMAVYSCFKEPYEKHVLSKPGSRTAWTSIVLFAVLVPAFAVLVSVSPRVSIFLAAVLALLFSGAATAPVGELWTKAFLRRLVFVACGNAALLILVPSILPPVPLACHKAAVGTSVQNRELVGETKELPAGTRKVYAWFLVSLPAVYHQEVRFVWYHEGRQVGRPFLSTLSGGRKRGYRIWTTLNSPVAGHWRVDMLTDADQLIGRTSFDVSRPDAP